jgi:hypothetical protein
MYMQVQNDNVKAIQFAQFITCSCDEVTIINKFWIFVHAYVVD